MRPIWKPSLLFLASLVILLSTTLLLTACSDEGKSSESQVTNPETVATSEGSGAPSIAPAPSGTSTPSGPAASTTPDGAELPKPGLQTLKDGRLEAVGVLTMREGETGFWAIVATTEAAKAAGADIVAVLGAPDEIPGPIGSYEGKYVRVRGFEKKSDKYKAGPLLEMESIETLVAPAVK